MAKNSYVAVLILLKEVTVKLALFFARFLLTSLKRKDKLHDACFVRFTQGREYACEQQNQRLGAASFLPSTVQ